MALWVCIQWGHTEPHAKKGPLFTHLKIKVNLCFVHEVWWSIPQGCKQSGFLMGFQPRAPCPSPMTSTSFYPGLQQGQVDEGWNGRVLTFCYCAPFPVRLWAWVWGESGTYGMSGWSKALAASTVNTIVCSVSSSAVASHPPLIHVWSLFWHRGCSPLGWTIGSGQGWPASRTPFWLFTGSHGLRSQV